MAKDLLETKMLTAAEIKAVSYILFWGRRSRIPKLAPYKNYIFFTFHNAILLTLTYPELRSALFGSYNKIPVPPNNTK